MIKSWHLFFLSHLKTTFKEHKKDLICHEGHSNFVNHIVEEGHEMRNMEDMLPFYINKTITRKSVN